MQELDANDMKAGELQVEEATAGDENPKFGRLLLLLAFAVAIMVVLTFASEAYYMP